jgi:hypothetical protein
MFVFFGRVLAHVCATTVNWCEKLDPLHLTPNYLNPWLTTLQRVLSTGHPVAQEQVLRRRSLFALRAKDLLAPIEFFLVCLSRLCFPHCISIFENFT